MAEGGGHTNSGYVGSRGNSTVSIPGAYTITRDHDDFHANLNARNTNYGATKNTNNTNSGPVEEGNGNASSTSSNGEKERENWGSDIEFLMSCIALSVGLGNVWRFPFTALDNGGGAFVVPYLIVLVLVGKPVYYLEMLIGQFSSRGCVKAFDFAPIMRGVGYGQVLATGIVTTYYATLMALTLHYFFDSFQYPLPWSHCRPEWGANCIDSSISTIAEMGANTNTSEGIKITSAQYYFTEIVLKEKPSIDDGIGYPSIKLAASLAIAWIVIGSVMIKGVKSSGKASYFLALFPYVIMFILLIRSLTLPGAMDGVLYFLNPQWHKLMEPQVWYAAVTQVFFSLAVCFGNIIMYASYNRFGHNIYRDANIVTTLDTFTSLLSGIVIFGILGNLAYESNTKDIASVIKGGPGLAFISYPDAIAKFKVLPQLFSLLFFLMLFVLGIGSNVGMATCILTVIRDQFVKTKHWIVVLGIVVCGYTVGLLYITPGGQYVLNLLDFFGVTFVALVLAIFELVAIAWIYGVKRLCSDVHFMLGIKISKYYRICWAVITPLLMTLILVYTLVLYKPLQYNGYTYLPGVYVFGWCLSAFGIGQLVFWAIPAIQRQSGDTFLTRVRNSFKPVPNWGPRDLKMLQEYKRFRNDQEENSMFAQSGIWNQIRDNIFG